MSQLPEHLQNLVEEIKNEDLGSTKTRNPTSTKEKRTAFTCLSSGCLHPCFSTNAPYQAQQLLSHSVTLCFPALYSKEITFTITAASTLLSLRMYKIHRNIVYNCFTAGQLKCKSNTFTHAYFLIFVTDTALVCPTPSKIKCEVSYKYLITAYIVDL